MENEKKSYAEMFTELTGEFGPVPWWCWTGRMTRREMARQLSEMKKQGINEFFIMALYGLEYPSFLRKSYWDCVRFVLEKCREKGMKAWIYDDLNWPSGTAAGYLLREHPETLSSSMEIVEQQVPAGGKINIEALFSSGAEILYSGFRGKNGKILDVPAESSDWWKNPGTRFWTNLSGTEGTFVMLVKKTLDTILLSSVGTADSWKQRGYGDLLDGETVGKWMSYIHREYLERFSGYFGKTLRGFFFDEPYANRNKNASFAWTGKLFPEFRKRYGYSLEDNLGLLIAEDGQPETVKTRIDYMRLLTDLFSSNFARKVGEWCAENGVLATGHCMAEETVSLSGKVNGDIHEFIKWIQVPGMDMLSGCMPGTPLETFIGKEPYDYPLLMLTAKKISSTALYSGAGRSMCEVFGVRDWNCSLGQQKKDNDWLASMGISMINDNGLIYTISDFRKRALSGKHFTQPWWKHYGIYADYCRRVSMLASFAPLDAEVAVLYSSTSAHASGTCRVGAGAETWNETTRSRFMLDMLKTSMNTLFANWVDFEMLFEDVLNQSSVSGSWLECGKRRFSTVVVPGCFAVDGQSRKMLGKFADNGGKVVWLGCLPSFSYSEGRIIPFSSGKNEVFIPVEKDGKGTGKKLMAFITPSLNKNWEIENGKEAEGIWATGRASDGEYVIFLANHTGSDRKVDLKHFSAECAEILDVEDGRLYRTETEKKGESVRTRIGLREGQSLAIRFSGRHHGHPSSACGLPPASDLYGSRIPLGEKWEFRTREDNLFLPELHARKDPLGKGEKEKWYTLPINGNWEKAFHGKLPSGFTMEESPFYWVSGTFCLSYEPEKLSFIADSGDWTRLFINGLDAGRPSGSALWDRENVVFNIRRLCRKGENRFDFLVKSSRWRSWKEDLPGFSQKDYIEPAVIGGDFAVRKVTGGFMLEPPGRVMDNRGWNGSGYPHFAGTGIYSRDLDLPEIPDRPRLVVESAFSTAEVRINGRSAGIRAWKPYVFDISRMLKKGRNRIEIRVTNSLGNILRRVYSGPLGHEENGGITGPVYILYNG